MFAIAPTDLNWFRFLKNNKINKHVNFWTPTPWGVKKMTTGSRLYFMLKAPTRKLGGYGTFVLYEEIKEETAWEKYGLGNGCYALKDMSSRLSAYREKHSVRPNEYRRIGCIILNDVTYWNEKDYKIPKEYGVSFPNQVVKYKCFPIDDPFI